MLVAGGLVFGCRASSQRGLDAAVRAACESTAVAWPRRAGIQVRQADSVLPAELDYPSRPSCTVIASVPHSKNLPVDLPAWRSWDSSATRGWVPLVQREADGPDGGSMSYQRGPVRCAVDWWHDGGDDADSTYVSSDSTEEATRCWYYAAGVAPGDTGPH